MVNVLLYNIRQFMIPVTEEDFCYITDNGALCFFLDTNKLLCLTGRLNLETGMATDR